MTYEVVVDIEPRNKEFRVEVMSDTTVEEVISTLIRRCEDEGINISDWGRQKVGSSNVAFTMLRKSTGNTALAPAITFGELFPELEDRETFKLDARAQVGGQFEIVLEPVDAGLDLEAVKRIVIQGFRKYQGLASINVVQREEQPAIEQE